ncbi:MAG: UDP-glucose 6-dehydrogenase [Gammaproteobacteria bacterium]|nr:UDP-glucose 6-dehydrogenase [Gammaproteobacteria bacterium]|tara:strand:+ start:33641 stop:34951 length:1311 start_codon:yes stop_codon:yes gene_type:complete
MKITVVGTGYVGLVSGVCMSEIGHNVTCLDINRNVINKLRKGKVPYYEPKLEKMILRNIKKNNLSFSNSYKNSTQEVNIFFICVGTPENNDGSSNLKYVYDVAKSLAKNISEDAIVFIKSTVPVGTNALIQKLINENKKNNINIMVASNPEFLKEGDAVNDFLNPDRVIVGTSSKDVMSVVKKIYEPLKIKNEKIVFMPIKAAELTKYAANSFLATKISFINELSILSDALNINIEHIKRGIGSDPRIGDKFLNAGLGFGGSCFPKDIASLINIYEQKNLESNLLRSVREVNKNQRINFMKKILSHFKNSKLTNKKLMIWGLSFKPETDDIRESISIKLIKDLAKKVKKLYVYDPIAIKNSQKELNRFNNIDFLKSQYSNISECDALIVCTEWEIFKNPDMAKLKKLKSKVVFDGRNCLNKEKILQNNIKYIGVSK